ncbi:MAG TPA: phosphoribosylaminoimidazolesuccinocarboxamide synthase [Candidatus Altiarchaeales archaeon]|nr:phosphoribosylaminoimidazolesuccinocarboxamide synthase [Candidatus Altiarchaeales archaeon]
MDYPLVLETDFRDLILVSRGKVRDIYDLGDRLLIVVTDRLSAFDCVFPNPIPNKGVVLNRMSEYWFENTRDIIRNHLITSDVSKYPEELQDYTDILGGRSMIVEKAKPLPVECIARGYLAGSGFKEYEKTGAVCGVELPPGLLNSGRLPQPIFTPSTKTGEGHDINISFEKTVELIGEEKAGKIRDATLAIFGKASKHLEGKGILLADTKFEFGEVDGEIILIDEALTPDSSRFWPKDDYKPGRNQRSFDKQYVRDYLETLDWDKTPPAPPLPPEIVAETSRKYMRALELIAGIHL